MAEAKTQPTDEAVDTYFARVEPPQRAEDGRALAAIMARVSGEPPRMWGPSIVGFGSTDYPLAGGKTGTTLKIGFAARKPQLVLYGMGIDRRAALLDQLGPHSTGKGCLYVKRLSDVDSGTLEAIVAAAWAEG